MILIQSITRQFLIKFWPLIYAIYILIKSMIDMGKDIFLLRIYDFLSFYELTSLCVITRKCACKNKNKIQGHQKVSIVFKSTTWSYAHPLLKCYLFLFNYELLMLANHSNILVVLYFNYWWMPNESNQRNEILHTSQQHDK